MKKLIQDYKTKKEKIRKRLKEFESVSGSSNKDLFAELCFCLLTPQSKAIYCDKAIKKLKESDLLYRGKEKDIKSILRGLARFHNKKASYLVCARKAFTDKKYINIKSKLDSKNALKTRDWLVHNIKGLSYKEASHFLRNIGLGKDMAILDVHILKNLKRLGIINKIPQAISRKKYIDIEDRMRSFARKVNIPLEELDLLFWSKETGFIFK